MTMLTADKDTLAVINTALAEADQLSAAASELEEARDTVTDALAMSGTERARRGHCRPRRTCNQAGAQTTRREPDGSIARRAGALRRAPRALRLHH